MIIIVVVIISISAIKVIIARFKSMLVDEIN